MQRSPHQETSTQHFASRNDESYNPKQVAINFLLMMPRRRAKSKQRATTATTVENDILSTFQKLDQDDSGSLSENELFKHFQDVGLPKKLVKKLIKAADIDSVLLILMSSEKFVCLQRKTMRVQQVPL